MSNSFDTGVVPSIEKDTTTTSNTVSDSPALNNAKNAVVNSKVRIKSNPSLSVLITNLKQYQQQPTNAHPERNTRLTRL